MVAFKQIENAQNKDRARTIAVFVFLLELWLAYWLPLPRPLFPADAPILETHERLVWIQPKLVLPGAEPQEAVPSDVPGASMDADAPPVDATTKAASTGESEFGEDTGADDIRIVSFSPDVPQWVGDTARFTVNIEYSLASAPEGRVILSICSCKNEEYTPVPLRLSQPAEELALFSAVTDAEVKRGRSAMTLTKTFRVPVADELLMVARLVGGKDPAPAAHRHVKLNDAGTPPHGKLSTVRIHAIDPDPTVALAANQAVEFWISVDYNLVHEFGLLRLWMEDSSGLSLVDFHEIIRSGQRRLTFTAKFQIPSGIATSTITVNAQVQETEPGEISMDGRIRRELVPVRSSTIDSRTFRVKR